MLDYDEKSVLRCFCHSDGSDDTFTGVEEIRGFFDGLFKMLSDLRSVVKGVYRECTATRSSYFHHHVLLLFDSCSLLLVFGRSEHTPRKRTRAFSSLRLPAAFYNKLKLQPNFRNTQPRSSAASLHLWSSPLSFRTARCT